MQFALRTSFNRLPAVTLLVALMSVGTSVHAVDTTCHLALYHLKNAPSDITTWTALGFTVDGETELADFSERNVSTEFYRRTPGTALVFTNANDFSLMMRPAWSGATAAAALSFNRAAFAKAFAREKPSCATLKMLVDRAEPRYRASLLALAYLKGEASGRAFSWSDFVLSYDNAMYLRDGFGIDTLAILKQQAEWRGQLRVAAAKAPAGLDGVARLTRMIFEQNNLGHYCKGGNTYSSTQLMKCTACQGSSLTILAGLIDSGLKIEVPYKLGVQMFRDHWRPVLWDAQNLRFKDLTKGGGWITKVTDPIYAPEYVLDTLLRSPISGLAPGVVEAQLPKRDLYHYVIIDAGEEQSLLPTWVQRKFKTAKPFEYAQTPRPSTGLARYFRPLARTDYGEGDAPDSATLTFRAFDESVDPDRNLGEQLRTEIKQVGQDGELERPASALLPFLGILGLSPQDREILEPLKVFARQKEDLSWTWTSAASSPRALALQAAAVSRYSVRALAKALGDDRLADPKKSEEVVAYQRLNRQALVDALPELDADMPRLGGMDFLSRAVAVDEIVNSKWRREVTDRTFRDLISWLEPSRARPYDFDPSIMTAYTAKLRRLRQLMYVIRDLRDAFVAIHPGPSIYRGGNGPIESLITPETQALLAAAFAHAQMLSKSHRRVIELSRTWTPEQTLAFADFYLALSDIGKWITNQLPAESVAYSRWPEHERSPKVFIRRVQFPLQAVFEGMLNDPQVHYESARDFARKTGVPTAGGASSDPSLGRKINLPVVNFGPAQACGTITSSPKMEVGVMIECPNADHAERVDEAVTPEFTYALLVNQPKDAFLVPTTAVLTALLYSDEVDRLVATDHFVDAGEMRALIFRSNPYLLSLPEIYRSSADARDCIAVDTLVPDWTCLSPKIDAKRGQLAAPDLGWLDLHPDYRRGFARWLKLAALYGDSSAALKLTHDDERIHVGGFWKKSVYHVEPSVVVGDRIYTATLPVPDRPAAPDLPTRERVTSELGVQKGVSKALEPVGNRFRKSLEPAAFEPR